MGRRRRRGERGGGRIGAGVGTRVVTFEWTGAWGELRAVETTQLAVVPDNVDLGAACALPVARGIVQWIGVTSREPTPLSVPHVGHNSWRLESVLIDMPIGDDLATLVDLLAKGELDPQIGWRGSWDRAAEAADALLGRQVLGKAVLDL
jgi:NADPH:quinone reductase-like Zn-dependent oxidoreductase